MLSKFHILAIDLLFKITFCRASEQLSTKQQTGDREIARLKAQIRKAEMTVSSMEDKIKQKSSENQDLTNLCDDLSTNLMQSQTLPNRKTNGFGKQNLFSTNNFSNNK